MSAIDELLDRHASGADHGAPEVDTPVPSLHVAIVTCMDARIKVFDVFGLRHGETHILRNAGGIVTDDALRSLVISHNLLGTEEVLVIGHTDCGMLTFKDEDVQAQLDTDIVLHAFPNLEERIRESVETVSESPLLPDAVSGFVYEVETGKLRPVT